LLESNDDIFEWMHDEGILHFYEVIRY